ncbi:MAG: LCP family protein [Lachnospiraceae bacterium]|nr:LCP family protein [Lachnospiraceae bacterium]
MASRYEDNRAPRDMRPERQEMPEIHGPNWGRVFGITLSIVLAIAILGGGAVYYFGHSLFNMTNFVSGSSTLNAGSMGPNGGSGDGSVTAAAQPEQKNPEQAEQAPADPNAQQAPANGAQETVPAADPAADADEVEYQGQGAPTTVMDGSQETEAPKKNHKGVILNESELDSLHQKMNSVDSKINTASSEEVYNLMLVGVDRRDKSWNGNSDSMMLVSVNFEKKRVSIISLMRDTYVNIPDVGYNKLNNAFARGGGELMCQTITDNYNIDVTDYAAVDFENMIEIVDALGGVDLEWTDAEVTVGNGYMLDMCNTLELDASQYLLPGAGVYHCSGVQAVAYARNRYVGNSDYARTERQRYVISQMLKEMQTADIITLTNLVKTVLPLITHNVPESRIWDLVMKVPEIFDYDFVMDRVPYDNGYEVIYVGDQDMLVPDWESTITKMHETIYGSGEISDNSDNNQENRTLNNNDFAPEFEDEILNGGAEEETPYYGE